MSLYREHFQNIKESQTEPFLLGYIGRKSFNKEKIEVRIVDDDSAKHPLEWTKNGLTWRFVPEIGLLVFWESPSNNELILVKDWLEKNKYKIKKVNVYGHFFGTKKYSRNTKEKDRKPLGMDESTKHEWSCVILDEESQKKLKNLFRNNIPDGWSLICHHMTIDPFNPIDTSFVGQTVSLMVTHFGKNENAYAVKVIGYKGKTNNSFPHVTIAVNTINGGQQKDSNKITEWSPIYQNIILNGTIQNVT